MQRHTRREKNDKERSLKDKILGCRVGCNSQPLHKRRFWKDFSQTKKSARLKDADKSGQQTKVANTKSGALPDQPPKHIVLFFSFVMGEKSPFLKV